MSDQLFPVPEAARQGTRCDAATYDAMYRQSIDDPDAFWAGQVGRLDWTRAPSRMGDWSFDAPVSIKWFEDGKLNLSVNCIDRHLAARGDNLAIIWEPDDPAGEVRRITYRELHAETCRFANALNDMGVGNGDRVTIYLPMIPEAAYAMLACARIGAVHSVVFGGFSPDSLSGRIRDADSRFVVTADEAVRGGKPVPLKTAVDKALESCPDVTAVLVVNHRDAKVAMVEGRDRWWHEVRETVPADCPAETMSAEDPLFILYTSGSTGSPKGVLHTTGGYALWANMTFAYVFDYRDGEVFWCTADVGWVTGHSYVVYGPLSNGGTTLMFEGIPTFPDAGRFWDVVDKHKVNIFYTAPTALRSLMREGDAPVNARDLSSLRLLGTVGEPINPEAWLWYHRVVGKGRLPIVDTWWQTETGGIMISPLPGATDLKPGSATTPFFGVDPKLLDADGKALEGATSGNLVLASSWPGQARTVYGDHARFEQIYFSTYKGVYTTGDGARRDEDGYWWITGRVDDVVNVSGHRFGTAEIESALVEHPDVAEAAVVGIPHDLKGQGLYAYVTPNQGASPSEDELKKQVRASIGPIATPDFIHLTPALPKTRSGKIMRRILRKIAENDTSNLGDTSTLADPSVVDALIEGRKNC